MRAAVLNAVMAIAILTSSASAQDLTLVESDLETGVKLKAQKKYREAIKCFDEVVSINPGDTHAYFAYCNRGAAYTELGEYEKALADLNKAISMNPNEESAFLSRGDLFKKRGLKDKAIEDYSNAISLIEKKDDTHAPAAMKAGLRRDRAKLYLEMGNREMAQKDEDAANKLMQQQ
jgi:tetratricopeptide (TPR) repeat protein